MTDKFVRVPVEPTQEMLDNTAAFDIEGEDDTNAAYRLIYCAMIAAAPQEPEKAEQPQYTDADILAAHTKGYELGMSQKRDALQAEQPQAQDEREVEKLRRQVVELHTKLEVCRSTLDVVKEQRTAAQKALALQARAALSQDKQEPEYKGWYCAHCKRGVDGSEVTFREQHTVCGRVITDDEPPATQAQDSQQSEAGKVLAEILEDASAFGSHTVLDDDLRDKAIRALRQQEAPAQEGENMKKGGESNATSDQ